MDDSTVEEPLLAPHPADKIVTRVSNELGAEQPQAARLAAQVAVCMTLSEGVVLAAIMVLMRKIWGYAYSSEEEVVLYIARMLPILAVSFFVDGLNGSLSGVLTGCGKQRIGARVNLGAFYVVGIPTAVFLAFVLHLNGMGLWLGILCGSISKLVLLLCITLRTNWEIYEGQGEGPQLVFCNKNKMRGSANISSGIVGSRKPCVSFEEVTGMLDLFGFKPELC
ncbi:hypothetical protein ACP70R_032901 [Stipagrostis hirtigluma subsp. patula]